MVRIMGIRDIPGAGGRLFHYLATLDVNVEFISSASDVRGTANFILCMDKQDGEKVVADMEGVRATVEAEKIDLIYDVATIGVYGPHFRETPDIAANLFCCLATKGIQVLGVSTSISTVACLVKESELDNAREAIQSAFVLP